MRVYLSGGPDKTQKWGLADTKAHVSELLLILDPDLDFVHSGKSKYIVIPDWLEEASDTALKTGGEVVHLSEFIRILKRDADAEQKKEFKERVAEFQDEGEGDGAHSSRKSTKKKSTKRTSKKRASSKKRTSTKKKTSRSKRTSTRRSSKKR